MIQTTVASIGPALGPTCVCGTGSSCGWVWADTTSIDSSITVVSRIPTVSTLCFSRIAQVTNVVLVKLVELLQIIATHCLAGANLALPVKTCGTVCTGAV
jgi:hypothetical protein